MPAGASIGAAPPRRYHRPHADPRPMTDAPAPALAAFLRGVERRGAVFAELQAGDIHAGDAALAAAMRAFRDDAPALPVAAWPGRFWRRLLAQPGLADPEPFELALEGGARLGLLGGGPRAAVLLRLVAGLDEQQAADALAIAVPTYRLALRRAQGGLDAQGWSRLGEDAHRRVRALPPARLERLARARDAALHGFEVEASFGHAAVPVPRDRRRAAAIGVTAACLVALGATWVVERRDVAAAERERRVRVRTLGPAEPPASRFGDAAWVLGHPDYGLVADGEGRMRAGTLAFDSWLAARHAPGAPGDPFTPPAAPPAPVLPDLPTLVPAETDAVP